MGIRCNPYEGTGPRRFSEDEVKEIKISHKKISRKKNIQNASLLKKLERSNDAWIRGQQEVAALKEENSGLAGAAIEKPPYKEELLKEWKWAKKQITTLTNENKRMKEALDTIESMATDTTHDIQGIAQAAIKEGGKP